MLIKYVALGLLKVALVFFLPGYLLGAFAGFFPDKSRKNCLIALIVAFFAVLETAIFIEKGLPFFFGNLYNMVSDYPRLPVHLAAGAACDTVWAWYVWRKACAVAARVAARQA